MSFSTMLKKPSAFLPMAMSLAALITVIVFLAIFGVVHQTDEGAAAHIWQLLMGLQVPIVVFFAIKWVPRAPRQALYVLALQAFLALAALAPVYFLKL
jgi:membrane protein insertase Oxa1/YidC/SpoIIIJ